MAEKLKFNDEAIHELFWQYVESFEDTERHSGEAVRRAEAFDNFCTKHVDGDALAKIEAYVKMMDVAVEFEEGGFIAGFKTAMNVLLSENVPAKPDAVAEKARDQDSVAQATNPTQKVTIGHRRTACRSNKDPDTGECFITSVQIAEMFDQTNWKVVHRIENRILPFLDETSQALFKREVGKNMQNHDIVFYKLNQAACMMYLEVIEPKKSQFINIAGGYAKMQELMQKIFRTDAIPVPA